MKEERIYRTFTRELEEWSRTDKAPSMGNQDIRYYLFTDDLENSPVYEGQGKIPDFSAIVESVYEGSMGLNRGWVKNGYCYLDVYMSNIYDTGRLNRKDDMFRMVVCKSVKKGANLGFSIKKVQCAGYGGSFDATRQRVCPHCGNPYHLGGRTTGWYCRLKLRNISRSMHCLEDIGKSIASV